MPDQCALIPALWLVFGAVPFALFVAVDQAQLDPARARRAVPPGTVPAALAPRPVADRVRNLWPDPYDPVYYPQGAVTVKFDGGSVANVETVAQ
jgi:hypothetical protein